MNQRVMDYVKAFIAGFVSTLVFHQGVLALLHLTGVAQRAPYDLGRVPPLGIPAVISLAFWGGVWGAAIWPLLKNVAGPAYWLRALVIEQHPARSHCSWSCRSRACRWPVAGTRSSSLAH